MSAPVAAALGEFAAKVYADGVPPERERQVAAHVRDMVGIAIGASVEWHDDPVTKLVRGWGGAADVGALGRAGRYTAAGAAFIGGTLAHAIDFDDTHLPSVLHPSASVVPAALATAELTGATGAQVVRAVAVGDEICCRLGMAGYDEELGNSIFFENGLHATAICGAVGAAAASALLLGLDADGVAHAISVTTSMGSGILEANRTGGSVKRIHCGWAAHAGVAAAELVTAGLTGAPTAIEGRFGFLRAFCGEAGDVAAVTDGLGERWELDRLHVKPYPANHFCHTSVDAALEARRLGVDPDEIVEVELGLPAPVLRTVAEPPEAKAAPPTGYTAKFSAPFTFSAALLGGGGLGLGLADFTDERAFDPAVLAVAAKVRCVPDERCSEIFPYHFPAIARIRTRSGELEPIEVLVNRGSPERPLSSAEMSTKFADCASSALAPEVLSELDGLLVDLAAQPGVGRIVELSAAGDPA